MGWDTMNVLVLSLKHLEYELIMTIHSFYLAFLTVFILIASVSSQAEPEYAGKVFEITAKNARDFLTPAQDNQGILIEFFAPWCAHCSTFKPSYEDVAAELTKNGNFRVGACDITKNPAMSGRFDIKEIPVVYMYKNGELYKYGSAFHSSAVKSWARNDHIKTTPISYWTSPLGPFGNLKGFLIHSGVVLIESVPKVSNYLNIPEYVGGAIIAVFLGMSILGCTFIGVYLSVNHEKQD
jgi:thiol-disulfide isomerase/thioredoxin